MRSWISHASWWGPVGVQMAIIFATSSIPDLGPLPAGTPDWLGHGVGYAILGALLLRAVAGGRCTGVTAGSAAMAVVAAVAYGVTDEWHQSFVPGRTAGLDDLVSDGVGATCAVVLGWGWSAAATRRAAGP